MLDPKWFEKNLVDPKYQWKNQFFSDFIVHLDFSSTQILLLRTIAQLKKLSWEFNHDMWQYSAAAITALY